MLIRLADRRLNELQQLGFTMFGKKIVLSQTTLRIPNAVRGALEAILGKEVVIQDCSFESRRNWHTLSKGLKFYSTRFVGHFVGKGEERREKVSGDILEGYRSGESEPVGRTAKIYVNDGHEHRIFWDSPDKPRILSSLD